MKFADLIVPGMCIVWMLAVAQVGNPDDFDWTAVAAVAGIIALLIALAQLGEGDRVRRARDAARLEALAISLETTSQALTALTAGSDVVTHESLLALARKGVVQTAVADIASQPLNEMPNVESIRAVVEARSVLQEVGLTVELASTTYEMTTSERQPTVIRRALAVLSEMSVRMQAPEAAKSLSDISGRLRQIARTL